MPEDTLMHARPQPQPIAVGSSGSWRSEPRIVVARFANCHAAWSGAEMVSWWAVVEMCSKRREGAKDGPNFVAAMFQRN